MDPLEVDTKPSIETRRRLLCTGLAGIGLGILGRSRPALGGTDIVQPETPGDRAFIARAFEMREGAIGRGDRPYGAVVVLNGAIVGQAGSRVILDHDPTAHAEMAAIRDAGQRLQRTALRGATLYSSSRPCPMCEAAAAWAGIGEMVFGMKASRAGQPQLCR